MMKISKPVLMNDFIVSPVQFTSLNSVVFKNVKPHYDANDKIILEYEYQSKLEVSSKDWIGIFQGGWNTLQQYVTFEWVSQSIPCSGSEQNKENDTEVIKRVITFIPKYHFNVVNHNSSYQFVYVTKQIEVLGVSSYFRFDTMYESSVELECLVPVSGRIRSTSVSDLGTLVNGSSTTSLSMHSMQSFDCNGKADWNKPSLSLNLNDNKTCSLFNKRTLAITNIGDTLDPYSSHSEPVFPMSLQTNQCKKCFNVKKGGEQMRSHQVLQSKLKIVMERNKVLEERSQEIKKDLERLQAESKKMKMSFYNVNKEKVAYEKFVKDFIKSLEKDSIVRVMSGNTEILVKKVNYVGMEEHPRDKKTSKRERELKAVIGLQEITIRNLITSLEKKARSVEELNQTVKLAQVFSDARDDGRESVSDAEESVDEVSNIDACSEYEFSLSKPQPPEEVAAGSEEMLEDIRRASEMELKDIGINRSFGECSSRASESDLDVTSLSVRSYQNKEAPSMMNRSGFFQNMKADCWPFKTPSTQTFQTVAEKNIRNVVSETQTCNGETEITKKFVMKIEDQPNTMNEDRSEIQNFYIENEMSVKDSSTDTDIDRLTNDDYFDAIEALSVKTFRSDVKCSAGESCNVIEEESEEVIPVHEDGKHEEPENFSLTAIVPKDLNIHSPFSREKLEISDQFSEEASKKEKDNSDKNKKFTCALSIDFTPKRSQSTESSENKSLILRDEKLIEPQENSIEVKNSDSQIFSVHGEKSTIIFKQSSKCLEIKITQVEPTETNKNFVEQKMVLKFQGVESNSETEKEINDMESINAEKKKPSKFEINLALTGVGEKSVNKQETKTDISFLEKPKSINSNENDSSETILSCDFEEEKKEIIERKNEAIALLSPKTVWNDADDVPVGCLSASGKNFCLEEKQDSAPKCMEEKKCSTIEKELAFSKKEEEKTTEVVEIQSRKEAEEKFLVEEFNDQLKTEVLTKNDNSNLKLCQESLRYEKNLAFLQNKTEEKKEDSGKEKPSAILIQNGQTKVALIRYQ